jgi:hypothetical protein
VLVVNYKRIIYVTLPIYHFIYVYRGITHYVDVPHCDPMYSDCFMYIHMPLFYSCCFAIVIFVSFAHSYLSYSHLQHHLIFYTYCNMLYVIVLLQYLPVTFAIYFIILPSLCIGWWAIYVLYCAKCALVIGFSHTAKSKKSDLQRNSFILCVHIKTYM